MQNFKENVFEAFREAAIFILKGIALLIWVPVPLVTFIVLQKKVDDDGIWLALCLGVLVFEIFWIGIPLGILAKREEEKEKLSPYAAYMIIPLVIKKKKRVHMTNTY